ncbi:MAG: GGDEF domain-containing protein, partial [Pseudomonadota bacterium]
MPSVHNRSAEIAKLFADAASYPIGLVDLEQPEGPAIVGEDTLDLDALSAAWHRPQAPGPRQIVGEGRALGVAIVAPLVLSGRSGWVAAITPGETDITPQHHALAALLGGLAEDWANQAAANALWVRRLRNEAAYYERLHTLSGVGTLSGRAGHPRVDACPKSLDVLWRGTIQTIDDFMDAVVPHDRMAVQATLNHDGETTPAIADFEVNTGSQQRVTARLKVNTYRDDVDMRHFIATLEDVSAEKRHLAELQKLAARDMQTGLLNADQLQPQLTEALEEARVARQSAALTLISIDGLNDIVGVLGGQAGNQVITFVATTLKQLIRGTDALIRTGESSFAVVLRRVVDDVAAERRAAMIKDVLAAPVDLGGETIDISVSVGFAIFP